MLKLNHYNFNPILHFTIILQNNHYLINSSNLKLINWLKIDFIHNFIYLKANSNILILALNFIYSDYLNYLIALNIIYFGYLITNLNFLLFSFINLSLLINMYSVKLIYNFFIINLLINHCTLRLNLIIFQFIISNLLNYHLNLSNFPTIINFLFSMTNSFLIILLNLYYNYLNLYLLVNFHYLIYWYYYQVH